jgi:RNA 3'-terminal phosphate cyclase (ATP)
MITIDGAIGEGGGQILRTSLSLSLVTGAPFRMVKIRAARRKPGLLHQHLTAVKAAAAVGCAEVEGAEAGSSEVIFRPRTVKPGEYGFSVGTAGSAGLVLQTVLPPLLTASGPSLLTLEGGTHNPMAPSFDFLARAFFPLLRRMGPGIVAELERPGFYPAGGGCFRVSIEPVPRLSPLDLRERGEVRHTSARAVVARLPRHIAERELEVVRRCLGWDESCLAVEIIEPAVGPGNVLILEVASDHVTEVFTGFGERGVRAETVAERAADEVKQYLGAGVPVGRHLADQLLLPMALAGAGAFHTVALSPHSTTNIEIIRRFIEVDIVQRVMTKDDVVVEVGPPR